MNVKWANGNSDGLHVTLNTKESMSPTPKIVSPTIYIKRGKYLYESQAHEEGVT